MGEFKGKELMMSYLEEPLGYFIFLLILLLGLRLHFLRRKGSCKVYGTYFNPSELGENEYLRNVEGGSANPFNPVGEQPLIFQKEDSYLCLVMDPVGIPKVGVMACQMALEKIIPFYQQQTLPPKDFLKKLAT